MRTSFEQGLVAAAAPAQPPAAGMGEGGAQPRLAPAVPADVALRVEHLSKCHSIYAHPRDRLKQFLLPPVQRLFGGAGRQYFQEFWALRDVSFEVRRGESVAIIGRNGSGKSTLLQMISGTLSPTTGTVQTSGRIAALLELGSGFNPDFTGRENVFLNGVILGLTVREIEERLDSILAFADIGHFIDQPVKTYSSGMYVRLAFAIQVHVQPEILIVDEALSVGDFFFQQKCYARIRAMREDGLTLLFVSHDMGTVRDLCQRSVYLQRGRAVFIGESPQAIRRYLAEADTAPAAPAAGAVGDASAEPAHALEAARAVALWKADAAAAGQHILAVVVRDAAGQPTARARMGERLRFEIFFRSRPDENGHLTLILKNKYDQVVSCTGSYFLGLGPLDSGPGGCAVFALDVDMMLESGQYSVSVNYGPNGVPGPNRGVLVENTDWFGPLQVQWDFENDPAPFLGQFGLPVSGTVRQA